MDLINVSPRTGLSCEVRLRSHQITVDYSKSDGGEDQGPSPTELLVGALGACISISISRYCQTLDCPSDGLGIYLTYQLADSPKRISTIVVDVDLPEAFPESRKRALEKVIQACPVHNTLALPPEIDVEF